MMLLFMGIESSPTNIFFFSSTKFSCLYQYANQVFTSGYHINKLVSCNHFVCVYTVEKKRQIN